MKVDVWVRSGFSCTNRVGMVIISSIGLGWLVWARQASGACGDRYSRYIYLL